MLYADPLESSILAVDIASPSSVDALRLHLIGCTETEVRRHFTATFRTIRQSAAEGYSREAILPYRWALLEILVELRVRGLESDSEGNIYHPMFFRPVPAPFGSARKRQVQRLKGLEHQQLHHVCAKALTDAVRTAARSSKSMRS
jgi:hypothetical protein